jgi:hypothetical protein
MRIPYDNVGGILAINIVIHLDGVINMVFVRQRLPYDAFGAGSLKRNGNKNDCIDQ